MKSLVYSLQAILSIMWPTSPNINNQKIYLHKHELAQVCGSDLNTYLNECELYLVACKSQMNITIIHNGPCDLCTNVHCKYGAICENGACICPTECPQTFEPVCSSDGYTYTNECLMRKSLCTSKSRITVSFFGECQEMKGSGTETIQGIGYIKTCDHNTCRYGGLCDYDLDGIPFCLCSYQCPNESIEEDKVCGSDGRLYDNECKLQEEACRRQQDIKPVDIKLCEESKMIPCDGATPLMDITTGEYYSCANEECPMHSYCHRTSHFAKCCQQVSSLQSCSESNDGCCPDGLTPAQGPNGAGCPSTCNCNKLGSYSSTCDPITGQCHCKPGVGGSQCDRCEPGYWGLHKISEGNIGCIPCSCNINGSVRDDCEQMTGRCVCKHGLQGIKCNVCPKDSILGPDGCTDVSLTKIYQSNCDEVKCLHGAVCKEKPGIGVQCVCDTSCTTKYIGGSHIHDTAKVCGSDGNTYLSHCLFQLYACRMQKSLTSTPGECSKSVVNKPIGITITENVTAGPIRRSTIFKTTLQDSDKSSGDLNPSSISELSSTKPTSATTSINEEEIINVPSFFGNSYIELIRLQAYTRLSIELEFISYSENGILLYNGQASSGEGDFLSLSIKGGYVEFRYNLGSGTVILRSSEKIYLGKSVKLVAKRYLRDGMLTIEGQDDVAGKADGDLKSLDLAESLYIGYVITNSTKIYENIGIGKGFIGCIHSLRIGHKQLDLNTIDKWEILKIHNVHDCIKMPCSRYPCMNNGTCIPYGANDINNYSCDCLNGFIGYNCEIKYDVCSKDSPCIKGTVCVNLAKGGFSCMCPQSTSLTPLCSQLPRSGTSEFLPDFKSNSYLKLPTLTNVAQSFVLEIWFLTRSMNGLILYNGQKSNQSKGDFLSINLVNGYIFYKFNLGTSIPNVSGVATVSSLEKITDDKWHSIRITRLRTMGTLQVDDGKVLVAESKGNLSELNLDEPLMIGGFDDIKLLNKESGIKKGLNGSIQRVVLNGEIWDNLLDRSTEIHDVLKFNGSPCGPEKPCDSESICIAEMNDFHCKCNPKYSSNNCSQSK